MESFKEAWEKSKQKYLNPKPLIKNKIYKDITTAELQMIATWLSQMGFITGSDFPTSFCVSTKWKQYILRLPFRQGHAKWETKSN
jgi:hypothetical protein